MPVLGRVDSRRGGRAGQAEDPLRVGVHEQVRRLVVEREAFEVIQLVGGGPGGMI